MSLIIVKPTKPTNAQDGNSEFIIEHSRIPIDQLGGEENAKKSGYIVAKKNGRTYGVYIDGYSDELTRRTLKDAGYAFDGCEGEDAADLKMYRELEEKFKGFLREYLKAHKAFPPTYIEDVWAKKVGFTDTQIKYGEAVTPLQNARNYFKFAPRGKKEFAELTGKPTNAKDSAAKDA